MYNVQCTVYSVQMSIRLVRLPSELDFLMKQTVGIARIGDGYLYIVHCKLYIAKRGLSALEFVIL